MSEANWFAKTYYVEDAEDRDSVILEFIQPLFAALDDTEVVDTFHFARLGRPFNVEVRVRGKIDRVEDLVDTVEKDAGVRGVSSTIERTDWGPRKDDANAVGEEHLELLTREREYMSKRAIELLEAGLDGDELRGFFDRQSHLYANNLGFIFFLGQGWQPMPERD